MIVTLAIRLVSATQWPITYEQYAVTVSTNDKNYRFDFNGTRIQSTLRVRNATEPISNLTFYIRPFDKLLFSDRPSYCNASTYYTNALRTDESRRWCRSISTPFDYTWTTIDDSNVLKGLIFLADGDPTRITTGVFEDWLVAIEFECKQGVETDEPRWDWDTTSGRPRLVLHFADHYCCPTEIPNPATPTPSPTPRCLAHWRDPADERRALIADLNELNNGRFGYSQLILNRSEVSTNFILWQPCDISLNCPWGADCGSETNSSAWVCSLEPGTDSYLKQCWGYGTRPTSPVFTLTDGNIENGFEYDFDSQNGRNTHMVMKCEPNYPQGHIQIDVIRTIESGGNLTVYGSASEFCVDVIPTPAPLIGFCDLDVSINGPNSTVDPTNVYRLNLNLSHYNDATQYVGTKFWNFSVVRTAPFSRSYDLLYSPCAAIATCPDGWDCGGEADASVYVCEKWNSSDYPRCTAYGLHQYNISASFPFDYMFFGTNFRYQGHNTKRATALWTCNTSALAADELAGAAFVGIEDTHVQFQVQATEACVYGHGPTPSPPPRLVPPTPRPPSSPTPTPIYSPHSVRLIVNESRYLAIDLRAIQGQIPLEVMHDLLFQGRASETWSVWFAWDGTPCPTGWVCGGDPWTGLANLWQCWFTSNYTNYCHAVASKYVPGYTLHNKRPGDLDSGIDIFFPGTWGTSMRISAMCDSEAPLGDLSIDQSVVTFSSSTSTWTFNTTSTLACARPFEEPTPPTSTRTPPPSDPPDVHEVSAPIGDAEIRLDLTKLPWMGHDFILGFSQDFHRAQLLLWPWELHGCPLDKNCGSYVNDVANAWKCTGTAYEHCYPVGDRRYGVNVSLLNNDDPLFGIRATYWGGANGYLIGIGYHCNMSLDPGDFVFNDIGTQWPTMDGIEIIVSAQTRDACALYPYLRPQTKPAGGTVFLFIVLLVAVGYFGVGAIVIGFVNGNPGIPNEAFWTEVWNSLLGVLAFFGIADSAGHNEGLKGYQEPK
jgi:hypothetical protein